MRNFRKFFAINKQFDRGIAARSTLDSDSVTLAGWTNPFSPGTWTYSKQNPSQSTSGPAP